jgi:hypothetical protein
MEISDIFKDAIKYPFKDIKMLLIIGVILLISSIFDAVGTATDNPAVNILGMVISLLISFIVMGYSMDILKVGIDVEDALPSLDLKGDFKKGIKLFLVTIVYYIIPVIITAVIAIFTGSYAIVKLADLNPADNATFAEVANHLFTPDLMAAMAIVVIVAIVLYVIFTMLAIMGESRLAKTGSIDEAISFRQSYYDLKEIGVGKTLAVLIVLYILIFVALAISAFIFLIPIAGALIVRLIVAPFLVFMQFRAFGLLYSQIA